MITPKVMKALVNALQTAYSVVTVECGEHVEHTIPVDVFRDNNRVFIGNDRNNQPKTDGNLPQICRIVVDTKTLTRRYRQFLGSIITDENGVEQAGGWRHILMAISFLSTDWFDLFGKDIAWQMANEVEGSLMDLRYGIWDSILSENGATLLRKDNESIVDGVRRNFGIENIYQVTLAFQLTDLRIWKIPGQNVVGDEPIEVIESEVNSI